MSAEKILLWDAYLVIGLFGYNGKSSLEIVEDAIAGNVKVVQLREKHIDDDEFVRLALPIRKLCRVHKVDFIVNDRVEVAIALEADGIHVGQDDMPGLEVRKRFGTGIIGISASSTEEAKRAIAQGADYLGVGPIYPTGSKADAGEAVGTSLIKEIREFSDLPIVGIGGINTANAAPVIRAGAESVAVISAICQADDPRRAATELVQIVEAERTNTHI